MAPKHSRHLDMFPPLFVGELSEFGREAKEPGEGDEAAEGGGGEGAEEEGNDRS